MGPPRLTPSVCPLPVTCQPSRGSESRTQLRELGGHLGRQALPHLGEVLLGEVGLALPGDGIDGEQGRQVLLADVQAGHVEGSRDCLLYTSDAADDLTRVD